MLCVGFQPNQTLSFGTSFGTIFLNEQANDGGCTDTKLQNLSESKY